MTFKMPCLSKYLCYYDGAVRSTSKYANSPNELLTETTRGNHVYYTLKMDNGQPTTITKKEIIQYGKHVKFMELLTTGHGALKYRDVMEAFNSK